MRLVEDPMLEVSVFCIECGIPAVDDPAGWRACIGGGFDGESIELAAYCPSCAEREFGSLRPLVA